ncbi:hypothetical protein F5I97DRAFT_1353987 [Phlebopus sp. FC_14]|nr:hypothetical protein F5I97DRAFT_1353987 [Phlebopus sp. FC_14]
MAYLNDIDRDASFAGVRTRASSVSRSSVASRSSTLSICAKTYQGSPPAEPSGGNTNAYGSFVATIPASSWLRAYLKLDLSSSNWRARQDSPHYDYDTPPDSPLSSPSSFSQSKCPSISRTSTTDSSFDGSSPHMTVSSPVLSTPMADGVTRLHPVLEAVERGSKLSYRTMCSTCMKVGRDFPRCGRCGEMWCSRECRLQGGKKHVCAPRRM